MRKLLLVLAVLPIGTLLWPASASALVCDPAISRGTCGGNGQRFPAINRSAVRDLVASTHTLAGRQDAPERTAKPASTQATAFGAISVAMGEELSSQPGVDTAKSGPDKGSSVPPSLHPASQPGNAALLIAALLGMGAVARRRIASILG